MPTCVRVTAKPIKTSPDRSPSTFHNEKADKAFRYDGPTYEAGGKKKRKTPGAVNDGSQREDPSSGGAATTGNPGGGVGAGGMGAAGALKTGIRVRALIPGFILRRTGHQNYSGEFNGRKVQVRHEEVIAKGTYPGNQRQKRESRWTVKVDGQEVGEASTFRDARAMAYDACLMAARTAGTISIQDTEGRDHTGYIEAVKVGDRVRFKREFVGKAQGEGKVTVAAGEIGKVEACSPTAPSLTVYVQGVKKTDRGRGMNVSRYSLEVPAEELVLIMAREDQRVG